MGVDLLRHRGRDVGCGYSEVEAKGEYLSFFSFVLEYLHVACWKGKISLRFLVSLKPRRFI